jgi:hypothetical protein
MRERSWFAPAVLAANAWLLIASASPAVAAPGDLDISFGVEGRVTTSLTPAGGEAIGAVTQPDGKVVVVGGSPQYRKNPMFALARSMSMVGWIPPSAGTAGSQPTSPVSEERPPQTRQSRPMGRSSRSGS